jgi:hypothetical protein
MALHQLLSMIPHEVIEVHRSVVARWTETPEVGDWDPEPEYGAFVDERGRVVSGNKPARAFLETDDPRHLILAAETERLVGENVLVVFLDWGRQSLEWEEIFDLWEAWDSQGMIVDCGLVSVPWSATSRWTAPGWVAFADGFDGAPLATVARVFSEPEQPSVAAEPVSTSFLARAKKLKEQGDSSAFDAPSGESLPMLPFTLDNLRDSSFVWPQNVVTVLP